ncbi:MAG: DM13 domain-containing protein [Cyclobacteriaceae bacterium]
MKRYLYLGIVLLLLQSCVGTDILEVEPIPERIVFTERLISIELGSTFSFSATHFDALGDPTNDVVQWSSSNPELLSIDSQGLATALSRGNVTVTAVSGEAVNTMAFEVGDETILAGTQRTGTFEGLNRYTVQGKFTLFLEGDQLSLRLEDDFQADNGPGLYLYLATSGGSVTGGVQIGPLDANSGSQLYAIPAGVTLETYDFVIVYCQPFGVPFGFGEFDN